MRKRTLYSGLALLLFVVFVWIYLPVLTKYRELKSQEIQMTREIEALDKKVEELERERYLLQNDVQYLEKVIREEMGLVKPGETIYKIVEGDAPETVLPEPGTETEVTITEI